MKQLIIIALLLSSFSVGANSTQQYTACTDWGHAFPVMENGHYVWYQERTCTDYIIDWTTFPPTTTIVGQTVQRRGGYPPNVE